MNITIPGKLLHWRLWPPRRRSAHPGVISRANLTDGSTSSSIWVFDPDVRWPDLLSCVSFRQNWRHQPGARSETAMTHVRGVSWAPLTIAYFPYDVASCLGRAPYMLNMLAALRLVRCSFSQLFEFSAACTTHWISFRRICISNLVSVTILTILTNMQYGDVGHSQC